MYLNLDNAWSIEKYCQFTVLNKLTIYLPSATHSPKIIKVKSVSIM